MRRPSLNLLLALLASGAAGAVDADAAPAGSGAAAPSAPAPAATVARPPPASSPAGIAVGIEVGEPTSVTARWAGLGGRIGADAGIGSGTRGGHGLSLHGQVTAAPFALPVGRMVLTPYLGLGLRYYRHHYEPMSIDEVDDDHTGVRASLGLALALPSHLEIYAQGGPGWDLSRTDSCTLISGVDAICPHAQSSRSFVHAVLGVRFYL